MENLQSVFPWLRSHFQGWVGGFKVNSIPDTCNIPKVISVQARAEVLGVSTRAKQECLVNFNCLK